MQRFYMVLVGGLCAQFRHPGTSLRRGDDVQSTGDGKVGLGWG